MLNKKLLQINDKIYKEPHKKLIMGLLRGSLYILFYSLISDF